MYQYEFPKESEVWYSSEPTSIFSSSLNRHIWRNGYLTVSFVVGHSLDDPSNINLSDVESFEEIVSKLDGEDDLPSTVSKAQG